MQCVLSNVAEFNGSFIIRHKGNYQVSTKKNICNDVHNGSGKR